MLVDGSLALKAEQDPKRAEMLSYLSEENGYWLLNDIWRADSKEYVSSGIKPPKRQSTVIVDFSSFQNADLKLEMKYFLLYDRR